ncbi:MAG TPA: abortive infection family protein [Acidimicrobiales bacterium]|nr:abortive infection family protein [Acidimicrobiales bacterium]
MSGARRNLVERYYATVDWTNPSSVNKVLRVYEAVLGPYPEGDPNGLLGYLGRDGFTVDDKGRIRASVAVNLAEMPVHLLSDASAIYEHIDRIGKCTDTDPGQAISGAKSLIEATTKLVLNELGHSYDERADVPALVKQVQVALKLHPDTLAPTVKGQETVKRLLGSLSGIAVGVAELRNEYGPDHGRTSAVSLRPRHAHLAVGCASTYCRMLLETLDARRNRPAAASAGNAT